VVILLYMLLQNELFSLQKLVDDGWMDCCFVLLFLFLLLPVLDSEKDTLK